MQKANSVFAAMPCSTLRGLIRGLIKPLNPKNTAVRRTTQATVPSQMETDHFCAPGGDIHGMQTSPIAFITSTPAWQGKASATPQRRLADRGVTLTHVISGISTIIGVLRKACDMGGRTALIRSSFVTLCVFASVAVPLTNANARIRGRVIFGVTPYFYYPYTYPSPYYYPYYRYYPYPEPYYYATPPDVPSQQPAIRAEPAPAYWYFCKSRNAYYPYIRSCPEAWQAVPAVPALPPTSSPTIKRPE